MDDARAIDAPADIAAAKNRGFSDAERPCEVSSLR